jgi:hypothetical protein
MTLSRYLGNTPAIPGRVSSAYLLKRTRLLVVNLSRLLEPQGESIYEGSLLTPTSNTTTHSQSQGVNLK